MRDIYHSHLTRRLEETELFMFNLLSRDIFSAYGTPNGVWMVLYQADCNILIFLFIVLIYSVSWQLDGFESLLRFYH